MLAVRMCATPEPEKTQPIRLPKRLTRIRRAVESKRMDSFKRLQESVKQTAKEEKDFIKELFEKAFDLDEE